MKSTGIVRKIDSFGRIVIPIEMRRTLRLTDSVDMLEIYCEGSWIVLRKYAEEADGELPRAVSVTRRIDELGRVLIPKEVRRTLGITGENNDLEFFTREDGCILLGLSVRSCCFCGGTNGLKPFRGKLICMHCVQEIIAMYGKD